ncbi:MAG: AAA family ATPase [Candidatus Aenigmarchaeota archaeon]|nr:AAA family ATPase [Candidatus Aenigmarchaeota archaeon]
MSETWFKKFGWSDNPFKIRPDTENIIGFLDIRTKLLSHVHSQSPLLLLGPTGTGKTTLLYWLKDKKNAIYINLLDFDEKSSKKKITGLKAKAKRLFGYKNIVLLDEAHAMPPKFSEWIRAKYDKGEIDSLVMAMVHDEMKNFSDPFKDRVGSRKLEMRTVTEEEAFKIVRQRMFSYGKENPFTDKALQYIFSFSKYHPRKILENCEKCCIHASWKELLYIDENFVKKVLTPPETKPTITHQKPTTSPKLSPTQQKIISLLSKENLTTNQIASKLGISRASAAKQISRLMLRTDKKSMRAKGISSPLLEQKNKGRPIFYGLKKE